MGLGLEGAYGAEGAAQALRQVLLDRFAKQQALHAQTIQDQTLANQTRSLDQNDAYRKDALAETARTHDAANQDRIFKENMTLNEAIPPGTELPGSSPIVGRLQALGSVKPRGIDAETPPMLAADPKASAELPGTIMNAPSIAGRLFMKQATQKQLDTNADNERQAAALKQSGENQDWKNSIAQELATLKGSTPPKEPTPHYQLQPEVDPVTGKQTGRFLGFNTLTNSWEPVKGTGPQGTKAPPGAAAAATEDRTKLETQDTLTQLDQAIENAKDLIGPGQGRISNLEQMAGSADPRIQALGVKMKAAKMRVDHAITGSVRAGASPVLLAQWDNILANKITPEGLKAGVQAMREIVGGKGAAPATGASGGGAVEKWGRDASGKLVRQP